MINRGIWPGLLIAAAIVLLASLTLAVLGLHSSDDDLWLIWQDIYLWHVILFTCWQALLSVFFAVLPAIPLSRALYRRRFYGRDQLLRLCTMTMVLPTLVAIFGLLTVYGQQGWLANFFRWLGIEYRFSPYGLQGILLAHVFFNLPLATRLLLQSLQHIPTEQRQLSAQLGMTPWQQFRFVEWPALRRQLLPTSMLIFMLCFTSFAVVLTLGGGPRATTIELAIYQALSYDFNLSKAALLALIQLTCCLGLLLISQHVNPITQVGATLGREWHNPADSRLARYGDGLLIIFALCLLLPPLLAVVINGLNLSLFRVLQQPELWQALLTSVRISLASGVLSITLAIMLLWSSREFHLRQYRATGAKLEMYGSLILAMPGIVLATGLFILLNDTVGIPQSADLVIILVNALMALPFVLKMLHHPMFDLTERYQRLMQSLGIHGWRRLYWIELPAISRPLTQALALACVISLGDFGAIALFGNTDFRTLPFYLYQQIGAYRTNDGAVTALLLLLLCFILFTAIEKLSGQHANSK